MTLHSPIFTALPLSSIQPRGWLRDQLQLQADGLTGHLDEFWPSVQDSRWIGGEAEGWERGPYWLDGLIPLAFALQDEKLQAKARHWVDFILAEQHLDGWLGAKDDAHEGEGLAQLDPWPLFVLFKAFLQWHDATGDARIVPALLKCARRVQTLLQTEPLRSWARLRWADFVLSLHQLHELSGEDWPLELAATCQEQGYPWNAHFADLPLKRKATHADLGEEVGLPLHGVNNAMGLKTGAVWWRQSGRDEDFDLMRLGLAELDKYHGSATGMFNADEHLAGLSPSQGFEVCAIVEEMFSLEVAGAITGNASVFDRLEQIAFNALAAGCTPDMWAHQYHQQTNQVLCSHAQRDWTDSGPRANVFGQDVHFGCCQANLHQGWPKFAESLWMKTETGIAATAFAPCAVTTEIGGVAVTIEETTDYPFRGAIAFSFFMRRAGRVHAEVARARVGARCQLATRRRTGSTRPGGSVARHRARLARGRTIETQLPDDGAPRNASGRCVLFALRAAFAGASNRGRVARARLALQRAAAARAGVGNSPANAVELRAIVAAGRRSAVANSAATGGFDALGARNGAGCSGSRGATNRAMATGGQLRRRAAPGRGCCWRACGNGEVGALW